MNTEKNIPSAIKKALKNLPQEPGVYQFFDEDKRLLYIGKALNLRKRVRSYFHKSANHSSKTRKMVKKIADITYVTVRSEVEALVLEANFVHEHKPPFNILLRDDKHFLYVKITKEPFPKVVFTRKLERDGSLYFGPYAKAKHVRKIIEFLREILLFRTCKVEISQDGEPLQNPENRKIPCLDFQIRRCTAPCNKRISVEKYNEDIQEVVRFLRGNTSSIKHRLQDIMNEAAQKKEFEKAGRFRDLLIYVQTFDAAQVAAVPQNFSADVIGFSFGKEKSFFHVLYIRKGKILRTENFSLLSGEDERETFLTFLRDHLSYSPEIPPLLLVPEILLESQYSLWEAFIEKYTGRKSEIRFPQRGAKRELLEIAQKNAALQAANSRASYEKKDVLDLLQKSLMLSHRPERIECYDISHLSGTHPVGSQIVFLEGKPAKSEYRKYKIKTLPEGKIDDFQAMAEVLGRRLQHLSRHSQSIVFREVKKQSELQLVETLMKERKIFLMGSFLHQFVFRDESVQKDIGYIQLRKIGRSSFVTGLFVLPKFYQEFIEAELLQVFFLSSREKTLRFLYPKRDLRLLVSLQKIGFSEEKNPPQSFQKSIQEHKEKTGEDVLLLKISPKKLRKNAKAIPDLLVIDGGKGQLSAVVKVLDRIGLSESIPVCSLAKREEEIFIPSQSNPLVVPKNAPENQLLQQIRDEAHRFAITFNKQLRKKSETASVFDEIPGIGAHTKKKLFQKFKSPSGIFSASDEDLLEFVSKKILLEIRKVGSKNHDK